MNEPQEQNHAGIRHTELTVGETLLRGDQYYDSFWREIPDSVIGRPLASAFPHRRPSYGLAHQTVDELLLETRAVAASLNSLNAFMAGPLFPLFPRIDKDLYYEQQRAASSYLQVLGKRLERAGKPFNHG